jgi:hypothetical protein
MQNASSMSKLDCIEEEEKKSGKRKKDVMEGVSCDKKTKRNAIDWICNLFLSRNFIDARERAETIWNHFTNINEEYQKMRVEKREKTGSRYFALSGFGCLIERRGIFKVLSKCLKPQVMHCAQVSKSNHSFEMIVGLNCEMDDIILKMFEDGFDMFNMSLYMTPFDRYLEPAMVTGIERIMFGIMQLGNLFCKKNQVLVRDVEAILSQRQREGEMQRVRSITGLNFTPANMLSLHHDLVNLRIENMENSPTSLRQDIRSSIDDINQLRMQINETFQRNQENGSINQSQNTETEAINGGINRAQPATDGFREVNTYFILLDSLFRAASRLSTHINNLPSMYFHPPPEQRSPTSVTGQFDRWSQNENVRNWARVGNLETQSVLRPIPLFTFNTFLDSDTIAMIQDPETVASWRTSLSR